MIAVGRKASLGLIAGSMLIALGVAFWFVAAASDGLRRLPYFLRQPEHRARLIREFGADWSFWVALFVCAGGCIFLLVRIIKRGRL